MKKLRIASFGRGFTLIELLVLISINASLASLLVPAPSKAKERAKAAPEHPIFLYESA